METNAPNLFNLLQQKMSYLNQKQTVLAENVANADTPGYKAKEISAFSFGDALRQSQIGMSVTDTRHIVPASLAGAHATTVKAKSYDVALSGNSVNIEEQMMDISKTSVDYQEMTGLLKKLTGLFKIALKGSST